MTRLRFDPVPWTIALVAILSFWKVWLIRDVMWDDNCWLLSRYATDSLDAFLKTGFYEMRREALGVYTYLLHGLHRDTDYFFPAVYGITALTQIGSPVLLYYLVRSLAPERPLLAALTGLAFVGLHLDHNLAYISAINYRLGLMFMLASLLLTARAVSASSGRAAWQLSAILCAALVYYVLFEGAIALEAARLIIIVIVLGRTGLRGNALVKKTLTWWMPFLALCLPLIAYKFLYKPYGTYQGSYPIDPWRLLNFGENLTELRLVLASDWLRFWKFWRYADTASSLAGLLAAALIFVVLRRAMPESGEYRPAAPATDTRPAIIDWPVFFRILLVGVGILLPPILLFQATGLSITFLGAQDNTHAIMLLPGYALIMGNLLAAFLSTRTKLLTTKNLPALFIACILGLGVYYNNLAIDIFRDSWRTQSQFWRAFLQKFPALPESADFMIDARLPTYYPDLRINFDFEYTLNLLYARSTDPGQFRRYRVFTNEEFYRGYLVSKRNRVDLDPVRRGTHFGYEMLDPRKLIVVYYDPDGLRVNREILAYNPKIEYRLWADKDSPALPEPSVYPYRGKYYWPD